MYSKDVQAKNDSNIDAVSYVNQIEDEREIEKDSKNMFHMITTFEFNASSADLYLLNGVDIRLRFDLASAKLISFFTFEIRLHRCLLRFLII